MGQQGRSATGGEPVLYHRVCDLPERLRPREELERQGAENVSDRVLLAVLLRGGIRGQNVMDLAEHLLRTHGSLTALAAASVEELAALRGMGRVKALTLKAALELARRLPREGQREESPLRTPEDAARILRETASPLDQERFWVLKLDAKNRLRGVPEEITRGILDASLIHPREVFRRAIQGNCAAVIVVHNHPSGDPTPSAEDVRVTRQLVQAGRIVGIKVMDHVVLGRRHAERQNDYVSLREAGLVDFSDGANA
jgi:DNA repair protein RadC